MYLFIESEAIEKLREKGYRVIKEDFPEAINIKSPRDLVRFFYARRFFYNPDRRFPDSINYKEDLKYLGGFLRKRQELGLNRSQALKEATIFIETLFKYEKHFNLKEPISSPSILAVGFIVDRICSIINGEASEVNDVETEKTVAQLNEEYNRGFAERDALEASERMSRILERLNVEK